MQSWQGWPLERFVYLFLAAAYLLVWMQVSLLHWRGGFRNIFMWGPVIYTPLLVITGLLLVAFRSSVTEMIFVVTYGIAVLEGAFGTYKHFHGVNEQVGGITLRNLMTGPPVILPMTYAALGAFGVLVHYWPALTGGSAVY